LRIIAGKFRGRKLLDSSHLKALRPTTDANRESLFNILSAAKFIREIDFEITNCQIIDVCCGSGAVAFEALSRGAKKATLIDNSRTNLELAKSNAALLKIEDQCHFSLADVKSISPNLVDKDLRKLIFLDPPYEENYEIILQNLIAKEWLKKNDLLVIEMARNKEINFSDIGLDLLDMRICGNSLFVFAKSF
jgi:16S rRNA (guanine966-N2)-methyltransferase